MRCICVRACARPSIYLCICHKLFSYTAINACTLLNHFWPKNLFFLHNYFLEERTTHITLRFIAFFLGFCACMCVLVGAKSVWMLYKNRWALSMFVQFINKIKVVSLRVLWCRCLKGNVRYGITGWWPTKPGITMLFVSPRMANIDTNSVCFSFHSHCWSKQPLLPPPLLSLFNGRLQGVEKSMWHRLSFCNRHGNRRPIRSARMLCEVQKWQYTIQVLHFQWPHWD